MVTRQAFLFWLEENGYLEKIKVFPKRFYKMSQADYVFEFLEKVKQTFPELSSHADDFITIEEQRYHILKMDVSKEENFLEKKKTAIDFSSLSDAEKRLCTFKTRPNLSEFLVTSEYDWTNVINKGIAHKKRNYFFMPSFLPLMPKEVQLNDFNAVLLDLINFEEEFTYLEFFHLIKDTLDTSDEEIDKMLLEFLSSQVLYYETIVYIPKQ